MMDSTDDDVVMISDEPEGNCFVSSVVVDEEDEEDEGEDCYYFPQKGDEIPAFEGDQLDTAMTDALGSRVGMLATSLGVWSDDVESPLTLTANGALCLGGTGSAILDLFAKCGAMRGRQKDLIGLFLRAVKESPSYAMRCLFYLRDIRGGQGERELFRSCMRTLAASGEPFLMKLAGRNMRFIPEYGRFDDVVKIFEGTPLQGAAMRMVKVQLQRDSESESPSLLAKWLPSENASSLETKRLASVVFTELEMPPRKYRKTLSGLRKKIDVVERRMSRKQFGSIDYGKVPSLAFKKYAPAFHKRDGERFRTFLGQVESGEKTVNAAALYPYDLVRPFFNRGAVVSDEEARSLDVQWKALPDFLPKGENAIVVVDTSGSMMRGCASVPPICVAVSLGIYIGERMPHKSFISFSDEPEVIPIRGATLRDKCENMSCAHWDMNTNLQKVFDLLLNMALMHRMDRRCAITKLFIISDMQFDQATAGNGRTNFQEIERKYAAAGLKRPDICYWNVNASVNGSEVAKDESGAFLVSGCSPSVLKSAMVGTPVNFMMEVLNGERYKRIH